MASVATPSPVFGGHDPSYLIPGLRVSTNFIFTKGDKSRGRYDHHIFFKNDEITVDGKFRGKVTDPQNQAFLKSLRDYKCPDEFRQEGVHVIFLVRLGDKDMPVYDDDDDDEEDEEEFDPSIEI